MGRLIFLIVFFIFFAIFAVIKFVGSGVKSAYKAVFNPEETNARLFLTDVDELISECVLKSSGNRYLFKKKLKEVIKKAKKLAENYGYELDEEVVKGIIIKHPEIQRNMTEHDIRYLN